MAVNIEIITLSLLISLALMIIGYFLKKKAWFFFLSGSVLLIVTGVAMLGGPVLFKTGTVKEINVTGVNTTIETEVNTYAEQNSFITQIVSFVIMIIGFFGTVMSTLKLYSLRFEEDDV